jgi:hypothetical protein
MGVAIFCGDLKDDKKGSNVKVQKRSKFPMLRYYLIQKSPLIWLKDT